MPDPRGAPYLLRRSRKESKYDLMTEAAPRMAAQLAEPVTIRPYRPLDHRACRDLWAELVQTKRELYKNPGIGGPDPGAGFEEYLTRLDLAGTWRPGGTRGRRAWQCTRYRSRTDPLDPSRPAPTRPRRVPRRAPRRPRRVPRSSGRGS